MPRAPALAPLAAVLLVSACSDPEVTPAPATYASVQAVFTRACSFSSCHGGTSVSGGLRLVAGESYAAIVNVPSTQVTRLMRVRPGDPDASWLMHKVDNTLSAVPECQGDAGSMLCGVSMPERDDLIPASERDLIRRWIMAGAPGP